MSSSTTASASNTNSASNSKTASGSGSASNSASTAATSSVSIPQTAANGGVTVTQPPSSASASYYKIAEDSWVTFGWNFTSLYVTPTSLTVIASCSANGYTYSVGPTTSPYNVYPGNTTQIEWNPWQWEQNPTQVAFAEATYVLKIWDERGEDAGETAGYMSPYSGTDFMMYRPAGYTSIADGWEYSNAFHTLTQPAHLAMLCTLLITLLSAWGILRR
ncbi:hypothetical protein I350_04540 [Cryptococcus amylolentus CBS 6273]|uniref:DUF7137 domain-containing protein n=1 Tax=Cryptococcus amylolentus CBS 6273 TaxID=1296118 RepID=A0A1E3JXA7_9TREE|nr:hypothetical protein I350_04540 [Cryptococcus amylolentus CBS 6273]